MSAQTDSAIPVMNVIDATHTERRRFRFRPSMKSKGAVYLARFVLLAAFIAGWEVFAGTPGERFVLIDKYYVSQPSLIIDALRGWVDEGILWKSILTTLQETLMGLTIGSVLGMLVGVALGVNRTMSLILSPFVDALYSIPKLALVPLFMLWFGIGLGSKVAIVSTIVFFLVFYATFAGVRDVDTELIDKLRLMNASPFQVHRKVTLPAALTFIVSGLNISAPYALVSAVTAEMLGSNQGLGYLLTRSSGQFYTAGVYAAIMLMSCIGLNLLTSIRLFERRVQRWKTL